MKGKSEPICIGKLLFARTYKGNMNYFINLNGRYSNSIPEETESLKFSTCVGLHRGKVKDLGIELGLLIQSLRPLTLFHGPQPGKGCGTIPAWLGPILQPL